MKIHNLNLMGLYAFLGALILFLIGLFIDIENAFFGFYFLLIWIILNQMAIWDKIKNNVRRS